MLTHFDVNSFFLDLNLAIKNPIIAPRGISKNNGIIMSIAKGPCESIASVLRTTMNMSNPIAAPTIIPIGCNIALSVVLNWFLLGIAIHKPKYIIKGTNNSQEAITNAILIIQG